MGVHGLWQLLQSAGRPVSLESLEGKILAVDVSIWLHQTMKGMRDKDGNPLPNAHLQGLFSRVCKLLYYRIKPVFVFDGGVPVLKRQTMAARRERKAEAERESSDIAQKLLRNLVQSSAVKQALGDTGKPKRVPGVQKGRNQDRDIFELAPLPESEEIGLTMNAEQWEKDFEQQENWIREGLAVLSDANPDSEEFRSLPMEIQHEILHEIKEQKKYHNLRTLTKMPEDSDSFSSYQLKKLMKQSKLTNRIEEVRKEMSSKTAGDITYSLGDDYYGDEVEARRIVSEDAAHYVLIKGLTKRKQEEEAEKYELENKVKVEKEEDDDEVEEGGSGGFPTKDQKSSQAASKKCFSGSDSDLETLMARRGQLKRAKKKKKTAAEKKPGPIRGVSKYSNIQSSHKRASTDKGDCLQVPASASVGGNDEINERDSSSEDEGFIEVTIDPNAAAEDDDLFPSSIFERSEDPCKDVLSDMLSHASETEPALQEKSGHVTSAVTAAASMDDEVVAKRKSVLSDILSQLAEKKKSLTVLLSDSIADDDDVKLEANVNDGGSDSGKWLHEDDSSGAVSAPGGHVGAVLGSKTSAPEFDFSASGGFIKEESSTDEDGEGVVCSNKVDASLRPASQGPEVPSTKQKSGNPEINQIVSHESSDEDDDLKLAIELSLQSSKTECAAGGKNSEVVAGANDDFVTSPQLPVVTKSGKQFSNISEDDLSDSESDGSFEAVQQSVAVTSPGQSTESLSFELDKELKDLEENDLVAEEEMKDGKDETSAAPSPRSGINTSGSLSTESPSKLGSRPQPEDFEENEMDTYFHNLNEDMLMDLNTDLDTERATLLSEQGKQNRLATSVTEQINMEAQELLRLFGIPYIVSPMEAEAQCAYLDITDQTQGTITDDSDIWLFGGRRMYKNFFNQSKHVELFTFDSIYNHFGLNREQLINVALLCGSDYTEGIQGVGPVRALEIMAEFPGDGLEGLTLFRKWWDIAKKKGKLASGNKIREHLKDLKLIPGFPSAAVVDAYLNPTVDDSEERFKWSPPELGLLREFAKKKFGWPKEKADQTLIPMMKQFNKKETQGRISSYFQPESFIQVSKIKSQRLMKALDLVKNPKTVNDQDADTEGTTAGSDSEDGGSAMRKESKTGKTLGNKSREPKAVKRPKSGQPAESDEEKAAKGGKKGRSKKGKSKTSTRDRQDSGEPVEKVGSEISLVENKGADNFMGVMSEKVKHASTLLEQRKARGRRGRGGNTRGKGTAVCKGKIPMSLDQVCPRIVQGKKYNSGATRKGAMARGVVNLSESSSESEEGERTNRHAAGRVKEEQDEENSLASNKKQAVDLKKTTNGDEVQRSKLQKKTDSTTSNVKPSMSRGLQVKSVKGKDVNLDEETHLSSQDKTQGRLTNRNAQSAVTEMQKSVTLVMKRDGKTDVSVPKTRKPAALAEFYHSTAVETSSTEGEEIDMLRRADVSVINKQNLPATLAYLNQRTKQDRFLLQQLQGHQPRNVVERRLEEHDKRRSDENDMTRVDGRVKEKKEKSSLKDETMMSFEDIMGGMDGVVPEKKQKLLDSTSPFMRSTRDSLTTQKNHSVAQMQNLTSGVDECRQNVKLQNSSRKALKDKTTAEDTEAGIPNKFARRAGKDDKKHLAIEEESLPERTFKTRKAVNFDQPIATSDDEDSHAKKLSKTNKFRKQMQHLGDVQSIRGHGILPRQPRGELVKGRAIAGKGKGRGKNRNDAVGEFEKGGKSSEGGGTTTNADLSEYSKITADDLGSDFSDCEF